jgi:hypothetical protein
MIQTFTLLIVNLDGNLQTKLHGADLGDCMLRTCDDQYFLDCEIEAEDREEAVEFVRDSLWHLDIVSLPEQ